MKFLQKGKRVELSLHKSKTSGKREKRNVMMEFIMKLDVEKVGEISTYIAEAWKSMRKAGSGVVWVELDRDVESQNIQFMTLNGEVDMEMEDVALSDLKLEKIQGGDVLLHFNAAQPLGKKLWNWLFYAEQSELLFAEFEECQQELELQPPKGGKVN